MDRVRKDAELEIASYRKEREKLSHIEQYFANEVKQLHERSNTLATELKKRETEIVLLQDEKGLCDTSIRAQIAELEQTLNRQSETLEMISFLLFNIEKNGEANRNVLFALQSENVASCRQMRGRKG
ncbi:MAG: hypothetical protein EZS28_031934 [Streblomastix strix]|uniref:Uncharacterized protein n=1 Tax=Streblomastix strix TaxID=222440 RepID=A0A5J4UPY0_9EUKA|nr:MAG: hypothetical protein EZS28_031934 [Streblomastix strix]